jgi:hypothetical protein
LNETVIATGEVYVEPSGGRLLAVPVQNSGPKLASRWVRQTESPLVLLTNWLASLAK